MEPPSSERQLDSRKPLWKTLLPWIVSIALGGVLLWQISPYELLAAFAKLDWQWLLPITLAFVFGIYLWDAWCLRELFSEPTRPLTFRTALHARGLSYLFTVINYELGQGLLAWILSRAQQQSLAVTLARCVVLAYIDLCVLLAMGGVGALLSDHSLSATIGVFCGVGLVLCVVPPILVRFSPAIWREQARQSRWAGWLQLWNLDQQRLVNLYGMRLGYFVINIAYAAVGLWICGLRIDVMVVLSVIPIVALVNALPISIAGLGTREATLLLLLRPPNPAGLVAFSLVWTGCLIFGRAAIGLAHLWGHKRQAAFL